jgi:hypothetical protein
MMRDRSLRRGYLRTISGPGEADLADVGDRAEPVNVETYGGTLRLDT